MDDVDDDRFGGNVRKSPWYRGPVASRRYSKLFVLLGLVHCGPQVDNGSGGGTATGGGATSASAGTDAASMTTDGTGASAEGASATIGGMTSAGDDCPPWETPCGGTCVDIQIDPNHCGGCDAPCGDQLCAAGMCVLDCGDLTQCGQSCVDLQADSQHCGACDNACPDGQVCGDSECETFTPTNCDSCPCDECRDNCCPIGEVVVCAMGECP